MSNEYDEILKNAKNEEYIKKSELKGILEESFKEFAEIMNQNKNESKNDFLADEKKRKEIMSIKDTRKRQQLIKENMELFTGGKK